MIQIALMNPPAGSFYSKAKSNFQISNLRAPESFEMSLRLIKRAAAQVNGDLGLLSAEQSKAIIKASETPVHEFDLDVYQAGAGTPFNMHMNEVLAMRADVHPNNHVNMSQSSNDVIPTTIRLAALHDIQKLFKVGNELINALERKAQEFKTVVKTGRTHLQDAVPVTLGQEFSAYASAVRHGLARLESLSSELHELGIGGTATGSGINTHPEFKDRMIAELSKLSGLKLFKAPDSFETTHSMAAFAAVSSGLQLLANELLRISNDFRLMASGPQAGFNEIVLPEVEPGSSIMPGKVNPSICEMLSMICVQVFGLNHGIQTAAQQGQLELNWHTPLITWDLLHMIEILTNGMRTFDELCVRGVVANIEEMRAKLEGGPVLATILAPVLGYAKVAEMVHSARESGRPFTELVPEEYRHLLDAEKMTG